MAASAYRRQVRDRPGLDFSTAALRAQYHFESHGGRPPSATHNGYTLGKWTLDVTLAAMREDFQAGLFTKSELTQASPAFVRRQIRALIPTTFFPYSTGAK